MSAAGGGGRVAGQAPTVSIRRAAWALLAGSLLGAALIQFSDFLPALVFERDELLREWRPSDTQVFAILFGATWVVFAVGLACVGVPLWWICHRLGWRGARAALALGFLATFSVLLIFNTTPRLGSGGSSSSYGDSGGEIATAGHLTSYGWYRTLWNSAEMALLGAVVGGIVWRLAYSGPTVRWNIIPGRE